MQASSDNFSEAVTGSSVEWAPPRVFADWDRTGVGPDGSIDDLSDQVGDSFTITHHLDDGLPEQVSLVAGLGSPTLEAPLDAGRADAGNANRRASTYFSPYNATSPISGFDRDVAPVTLDWGVITEGGPEYARLFTGQMSNIPVAGQSATLKAMSATRLKLSKLIQPPAIIGDKHGLNATWCLTYALAQAGLYVSPPPRSGCRWWAPMHGSVIPVIPSISTTFNDSGMHRIVPGGSSEGSEIRPGFIPGPYMLGVDCAVKPSEVRFVNDFVTLAPGADILSKANNLARVEFWVKGDPADYSTAPGGSGSYSTRFVTFETANAGGPKGKVTLGIRSTDRKAFLTISDGSTTLTIESADALPADGAWYFAGFAWDLSRNLFWITNFAGGAVGYNGIPPLVTTNLPATDNIALGYPYVQTFLPIAEMHITTGPTADPDGYPWLNEAIWEPGALVRPSILELAALAESTPREIWEFLGSFAQAELATMRTDELDQFCYLPLSYWAEPAQQVAVDAYSTSVNMTDIAVDADPTKIRNSVSVDYSEVRVDATGDVLRVMEVREIPPGKSTLILALDKPSVGVSPDRGDQLGKADAADVTAGDSRNATVNSSRGGTGTYQTGDSVIITVVDWNPGSVILGIENNTGVTQYFANNADLPTISLLGTSISSSTTSATGTDSVSVAHRGERGMSVSLPAIQRQEDAQTIATELAMRLAKARPTISGVELFPDPRRQPGDLVTLTDEVNTGASGLWRTQSITHTRSGSDYTQTATVRKAMVVGIEGIAVEGDFIAGP